MSPSPPFGVLPPPLPRFRRPIPSALARKLGRSLLHMSFLFAWFGSLFAFTPAGQYLMDWAENRDAKANPPQVIHPPRPSVPRKIGVYHKYPEKAKRQKAEDKVYLSSRQRLFRDSYRRPVHLLSPEELKFIRVQEGQYTAMPSQADLTMLSRVALKMSSPYEFSQLVKEHPQLLELLDSEFEELLRAVKITHENWKDLKRAMGLHPHLEKLARRWQRLSHSPTLTRSLEQYLLEQKSKTRR